MLIALISLLILTSSLYAQPNQTKSPGLSEAHGLGGYIMVPAESEIEMDPMYGASYSIWYPHTRLVFDLAYTKVEKDERGAGLFEGDEFLYGIMFDYLWGEFRDDKLIGPYAGAGVGYYGNTLKLKAEVFGQTREVDFSGSTWAFEAIAGYLLPGMNLWGSYIVYPNSDNVTGAYRVGMSFFIHGKE